LVEDAAKIVDFWIPASRIFMNLVGQIRAEILFSFSSRAQLP
jgi:hypothetical protein